MGAREVAFTLQHIEGDMGNESSWHYLRGCVRAFSNADIFVRCRCMHLGGSALTDFPFLMYGTMKWQAHATGGLRLDPLGRA